MTIEKDLLGLANKEREKKGLPLLSLSSGLSRLARQHSQDMAGLQRLSHASFSGKSYQDRLVEAGFYFISIGENVAFSETFVAEFIHQPLMESPEHRKNILEPSFDQAGIGVVLVENKGYYITQDFIQSLEPEEEAKVETKIQNRINALRRKASLPPLVYLQDANSYAREFSQKKAQHKPTPPCPTHFGENYVIYASSPSLEEAQSVYQHTILDSIYENAGLGVSFRRNKEYPGGSYFVTLILFPENKYKYMDKEKIRQIVLLNINERRDKKGLPKLKFDENLSAAAEKALKDGLTQGNHSSIFPTRTRDAAYMFFITVDPTVLSEGVKDKIEGELVNYRKIGIGISFQKNREYPRGAFWTAILLER
ncbi:MAG: hypothetical protein GTO17_14015 [Candidatus Aminicenantes bacterium]|nr:hypothetical protein [Candidatus Aminicenantes bacterium]